MNLMLFQSQIICHDIQMASDLTLTTHILVLSIYLMILCKLGHYPEK